MLKPLAIASVLAVLAAPAFAQDQRYPQWMMDEALPVAPDVPVMSPNALPNRPPASRGGIAETNRLQRAPQPRLGAIEPQYSYRHSLRLDRQTPTANRPVTAPPRAR